MKMTFDLGRHELKTSFDTKLSLYMGEWESAKGTALLTAGTTFFESKVALRAEDLFALRDMFSEACAKVEKVGAVMQEAA